MKEREYSTVSEHLDMVVMRIDPGGETRWTTIQKRPGMYRAGNAYLPDLWRIDGDTLRYLTRSVTAGTIALASGIQSVSRVVIDTELEPEFESGRWLGPRSAMLLLNGDDYNSVVRIDLGSGSGGAPTR